VGAKPTRPTEATGAVISSKPSYASRRVQLAEQG
jgi:hypothetical protein